MKEFWFWVLIVTLILFGLMLMSFGLAYTNNQIKKADAILLRAEKLEKEKRAKLEPKPEKE